jgi:putative ABC transport system substrate-binding protein
LSRSPIAATELQAFHDRLRELGQVEGRTYVIEPRYAEGGDTARLREQAQEAVRDQPDVIVAPHALAARLAKAASSTIPIVFAAVDPVGDGLVANLARPGGNATGVAGLSDELDTKRLELLRDIFPTLKLVAVLYAETRGSARQLEAFRTAAKALNLEILPVELRGDAEIGAAIEAAAQQRAGAITYVASTHSRFLQDEFIALAAKHRLPAIFTDADFVEAGGLMAYGPDRRAGIRRLAGYVDRILKGAKPADLPVEQPHAFEFAVNLKTARELGVTIPAPVLMRADRVVE